jgi:hypothetical protein
MHSGSDTAAELVSWPGLPKAFQDRQLRSEHVALVNGCNGAHNFVFNALSVAF